MDKANIDKTVICSIATKPTQFEDILKWSKSIYSDRIIPLPSIHPDNNNLKEKIEQRIDGLTERQRNYELYLDHRLGNFQTIFMISLALVGLIVTGFGIIIFFIPR